MPHISGTVTVTTSGTAVQLSNTKQRVYSITQQGHDGNTDRVWLGQSSAVAVDAGFPLNANEAVTDNFGEDRSAGLDSYWVDADVSGEKINFRALVSDLN